MPLISTLIETFNNYLWGAPMILLLLGTHIYLTIRTGFIQRKTFTGILPLRNPRPGLPGRYQPVRGLTTALASTIGTGNIIGVGTAIALGGPGAVLWCWLTGVFGIATKYSESLIAVKYRVKTKDGTMLGGAMYALERGLNMKWLGKIFAVLGALTAFGIGLRRAGQRHFQHREQQPGSRPVRRLRKSLRPAKYIPLDHQPGRWPDRGRSHLPGHLRRRQIHRPGLRAPGALHGFLLRGGLRGES